MSSLISPNLLRAALLLALVSGHIQFQSLVNKLVPEPYLDEVFHVPQAQAYYAGRWGDWDDKITTPPGLYVYSYLLNSVRNQFGCGIDSTTEDLRFSNAVLLPVLLVLMYLWSAVGRRNVDVDAVVSREFAIACFPLFFFFGGLYYTDLFSTVLVLATCVAWSSGSRGHGTTKVLCEGLHLVFGLLALSVRQTNIFWVGVFLGVLQLVESVRKRAGVHKVHDPPISEGFFEGTLKEGASGSGLREQTSSSPPFR
jgi:alpha-1,2-glucosyltransferase